MMPSGEMFRAANTLPCLVGAVIEQYTEFHEKGDQPGSEEWSTTEHGRSRVDMRVRAAWGRLTKLPESKCPWTRDTIIGFWIDYRKGSEERKAAMRAFAGEGQLGLF